MIKISQLQNSTGQSKLQIEMKKSKEKWKTPHLNQNLQCDIPRKLKFWVTADTFLTSDNWWMTIAAALVQFMINLCKSALVLSFPYGQNSQETESTWSRQPGWFVWGVWFFGGGIFGLWGYGGGFYQNSPMCDCNRVLKAAWRHQNCCNCIIKIDHFFAAQ